MHGLVKHEQLYNFYGRRSNKYLLSGYNFVMPNNKYDSFSFRIFIPDWLNNQYPFSSIVPVSSMIYTNNNAKNRNKTNTLYSR